MQPRRRLPARRMRGRVCTSCALGFICCINLAGINNGARQKDVAALPPQRGGSLEPQLQRL